MKKKLFALFLVLALTVCLLPASALAAPPYMRYTKENQPWRLKNAVQMTATEEADSMADAVGEDVIAEEALVNDAEAAEEEELPVPPQGEPTEEELAAAAELAGMIRPDGEKDTVLPKDVEAEEAAFAEEQALTVAAEESAYAYEGMLVYNNGGTVFNNMGTVYNNGGLVYNNGGVVYNNGGVVYANSGVVYNNVGVVYNNEADVYSFQDGEMFGSRKVFGYYELKFSDYYEPYVEIEGVTVEPGSEKMIISEDSVCRITPLPGYEIVEVESDVGELIREEDGSVVLLNVDADTTLTLTIEEAAESAADAEAVPEEAEAETVTDAEAAPEEAEAEAVTDAEAVPEEAEAETVTDAEAAPEEAEAGSALKLTAPVFLKEKEGYFRPYARAILVQNTGETAIEVASVEVVGKDADVFTLSESSGRVLPETATTAPGRCVPQAVCCPESTRPRLSSTSQTERTSAYRSGLRFSQNKRF